MHRLPKSNLRFIQWEIVRTGIWHRSYAHAQRRQITTMTLLPHRTPSVSNAPTSRAAAIFTSLAFQPCAFSPWPVRPSCPSQSPNTRRYHNLPTPSTVTGYVSSSGGPHICDVAVVGAGVAGLVAARELLRRSTGSLRVVVLEARDRVGGRTLSLPISSFITGEQASLRKPQTAFEGQTAGSQESTAQEEAVQDHQEMPQTAGAAVLNEVRAARKAGPTLSAAAYGECVDLGGQWVGPTQLRVLTLIKEMGLEKSRQPWFEDRADCPDGGDAIEERGLCSSGPATGAEIGGGRAGFRAELDGEGLKKALNSGSSLGLTREEEEELGRVEGLLDSLALESMGTASTLQAAEWDNLSVQSWLRLNVQHEAVQREFMLFAQTVLAGEPSQVSFLFFLQYIRSAGGIALLADGDGGAQTWRIRGGAQQLSQRLSQYVESMGGLLLKDHVVQSIAWSSPREGAGPANDGGGSDSRSGHIAAGSHCGEALNTRERPMAVIMTAHGAVVRSRAVIVALPPPLWSSIVFEPYLPTSKGQAASRMFMGSAVKTLALYREPFWNSRTVRTGKLEQLGPIANLFPGRFGADLAALTGIATGEQAQQLGALTEEEQKLVVLEQYAGYLGTREAVDGCIGWITKDWAREEFSRGGFTALVPPAGMIASEGRAPLQQPDDPIGRDGGWLGDSGDEDRVLRGTDPEDQADHPCHTSARPGLIRLEDREDADCPLRMPCGNLYWAGAETACQWVGYIEGAIESGERAAAEVILAWDMSELQDHSEGISVEAGNEL